MTDFLASSIEGVLSSEKSAVYAALNEAFRSKWYRMYFACHCYIWLTNIT
jgi:hypothetical protein